LEPSAVGGFGSGLDVAGPSAGGCGRASGGVGVFGSPVGSDGLAGSVWFDLAAGAAALSLPASDTAAGLAAEGAARPGTRLGAADFGDAALAGAATETKYPAMAAADSRLAV
jgi:hypothetical protein